MKKQTDFFNILLKEGTKIISGMDHDLIPFRIIEWRGKYFKVIIEDVEK